MKRCPDRENLYLFLDNELSVEETAGLKAHIDKCSECRKELQACTKTEKLIKKHVDEAFSTSSSHKLIMEKVRSLNPLNTEENSRQPLPFAWIIKALALTVVLLAVLYAIPQKNTYHGTVMAVTCQALDSNSYADKAGIGLNDEFTLETAKKASLSGYFLFKIPDSEKSSFSMKGKAEVEVQNSKPVFSQADIELLWISGRQYEIMVNGKLLKVEPGKTTESSSDNFLTEKNPAVSESSKPSDSDIASGTSTDLIIKIEPADKLSIKKPDECASEASGSNSNISPEKSNFNKNPFSEDPVVPLSGN